MSFSIVILSRDPGNLVPCVRRIWEKEPNLPREKIIVVNDGAWPEAEKQWHGTDHFPVMVDVTSHLRFKRFASITWIEGDKPFIFARNANIGIHAAGTDDVLLLNDDALLETPAGFTRLAAMAVQHPEFGIIASTCNNVGNLNQERISGGGIYGMGIRGGMCDPREDPRQVCFIAVLIPRATIDRVGLLDEDLTGYGFDDDLYCVSIRRAGLKIGIWDGCFVDHASLRSSYRSEENYFRFQQNAKIYERKLIEMGMAENEADLRRITDCGLAKA